MQAGVQTVQKLAMMAFQHSSKLVVGDKQQVEAYFSDHTGNERLGGWGTI